MTKPPTATTRRATATAAALTAISVTLLAILSPAVLAGTTQPAWAYGGEHASPAHAARTLSATDTAHLHYVRSSESQLYEEGSASGTLPGSMRAHFKIASAVTASFVIYTHGGTIHGTGKATSHASGVYESFAGTITVNGGTGRYTHAQGHAGLYGVYNRHTYALTIQTTGQLSY
jgi:hypothetical protein